ncbi:hypothetical protein [Yunchengibacter salinarum]|uniref:hypothetical protein n=1 Tax=Yunchengibacter salinarum TaxID=3133399 RepID=UPI0035B5DED8
MMWHDGFREDQPVDAVAVMAVKDARSLEAAEMAYLLGCNQLQWQHLVSAARSRTKAVRHRPLDPRKAIVLRYFREAGMDWVPLGHAPRPLAVYRRLKSLLGHDMVRGGRFALCLGTSVSRYTVWHKENGGTPRVTRQLMAWLWDIDDTRFIANWRRLLRCANAEAAARGLGGMGSIRTSWHEMPAHAAA